MDKSILTVFFLGTTLVLQNCFSSADLEKSVAREWIEVPNFPQNCLEASAKPSKSNIHLIQSDNFGPKPFLVFCDSDSDENGWLVIQKRVSAKVDFYRNWSDYKYGFGLVTESFWIGLDKLYALTTDSIQELLIVLENSEGQIRRAKYDLFAIGNENEGYAVKLLGRYSGSAGDSFTYHGSYKFSTKDRNNDLTGATCATSHTGAWWYHNCFHSNLNGRYGNIGTGYISWGSWPNQLLISVKMMIRPKIE